MAPDSVAGEVRDEEADSVDAGLGVPGIHP